jgi:hypothetical protein
MTGETQLPGKLHRQPRLQSEDGARSSKFICCSDTANMMAVPDEDANALALVAVLQERMTRLDSAVRDAHASVDTPSARDSARIHASLAHAAVLTARVALLAQGLPTNTLASDAVRLSPSKSRPRVV